ncbi:hypothetical protein [Nocardia sp. NPDC059228]
MSEDARVQLKLESRASLEASRINREITQIFEGTNQIQRLVIARSLASS